MTGPLTGKVALITGGSKGIGAATALRLARDGAKVAINYSTDASAADELVKKIGSDKAMGIKANASDIPEIEYMVTETVKWGGQIDILIANAGVLPMKGVEDTTEQDFDRTFALNVKGPYFLIQKAIPHMPSGSHIITLSSSLLTHSVITPNYLLYASTKGAIEQMTRVMAKDLGKKGIRINAIAPGPTGTELFLKGKPDQLINAIAGMNPFNKLGEPDEIADAMAFLASNDARWMNGQVVRINGGMS